MTDFSRFKVASKLPAPPSGHPNVESRITALEIKLELLTRAFDELMDALNTGGPASPKQ